MPEPMYVQRRAFSWASENRSLLLGGQVALRRPLEAVEVELSLLLHPGVDESPDLEVFVHGLLDVFGRGGRRQLLDHQRVELGVLGLFHPVMLQQALELGIQVLVVLDRVEIVLLDEPLDVEREERHRQRAIAEHLGRHRRRRPDHVAAMAEASVELFAEALEELDVLGLLARELDERPGPVVVRRQPRPRVVEHEGEDELLHEPEHDEIAEPADLVQRCAAPSW